MKAAVIQFPASNCDRDALDALNRIDGCDARLVWHRELALPAVDLIVVPGGFSYGDYLRAGAMAAHSPIMRDVAARAAAGVPVLGICNGFQVLTEAGLLPGALIRNAGLKFVSRTVAIRVETAANRFTGRYRAGQVLRLPVAHHDGNYVADAEMLDRLEGEGRVAFRYVADNDDRPGNPNGSARDIAGIVNESGTVLGMMPHPERADDPALGNVDGHGLLESLAASVAR